MSPDVDADEVVRRVDELTRSRTGASVASRGVHVAEEPSGPVRFRQILVGYDGTAGARDAVHWAAAIARQHDAFVTVALVLPETPDLWAGGSMPGTTPATHEEMKQALRNERGYAREMVAGAGRVLAQEGVDHETLVRKGNPAEEIALVAQDRQVDLVVIGPREERGVTHFFLGSVADSVKDHVPASVLIARNRPPAARVLLAADGSLLSRRAARVFAGVLPAATDSARVVHVMPAPHASGEPGGQRASREGLADLERAVRQNRSAEAEGIRYDVVFGKPAQSVLEEARQDDADLIVMGARGLSRWEGFFLGSVSNRVAYQARASVLLVKEPPEARKRDTARRLGGRSLRSAS